jgi:hypothetical protein
MIVAAAIVTFALGVFGMLIYIMIENAKMRSIAETKLEIETDAATKLKKANEIITRHSDPNDLDDSLRGGRF